MPWKDICPMDQRTQMVGEWLSGEHTVSDLSRGYGVSRKTIYKWIERYQAEGSAGFKERSRAPRAHPNAVSIKVVQAIVNAKLGHQKWGPKKLLCWLDKECPEDRWPALSTMGEILKREGLVKARRRRHRTPAYGEPFLGCDRPNKVWSADFKGQFKMTDGRLCYPLTITDNCSRYLLLCRGLPRPTLEETRPWFEWAFRRYGLPEAIRTDNGSPFASVGLGGLSSLSVWFIKLGIRPERIRSGHPEQNGRHERMHRTLKEGACTPRKDLREQQRAFDGFVQEFNFERPHEALGMNSPSSVYRPSERAYPARIPEIKYDKGAITRRVRHNGEIKWKGKTVYLSQALARERLLLLQTEDEHLWKLRYISHTLGVLDELSGRVSHAARNGGEMLPMCPV